MLGKWNLSLDLRAIHMKLTLKRLVYFLLLAAFAYAFYTNRDQLTDILTVLQEGVWYLVLLTVLLLGLALFNQALFFLGV